MHVALKMSQWRICRKVTSLCKISIVLLLLAVIKPRLGKGWALLRNLYLSALELSLRVLL